MERFVDVDPQWAWSPYDVHQGWDRRLAAHLYRRAGFAADPQTLSAAVASTPTQLVSDMLTQNAEPSDFRATADRLAETTLAGGDPKKLSAAWVYRLLYTPNQVLEKMAIFWHGHFATGAEKVKDANMMWDQNMLLRQHALGSFEPLVQAIARDPAMLIYLDSATNRKAHPNENFARELMELFCLGEGNYTEADVQQLARCFTGWEIKNKKFRKNRYQQDGDQKTVLGQNGTFDGEQGVAIVLSQDAMPRFICRKLFRFFVADEPDASDALLAPLAKTFRESGLQIAAVVNQILSSNLFFSPHALGRRIKSPVELAVGLLRSLEATTNTVALANGLTQIGQGLFFPPNVKGWDGGRAWINSSTLLGRANLVHRILFDPSTEFGGGKLDDYLRGQQLKSDAEVVQWLSDALLAVELSPAAQNELQSRFAGGSGEREKRLRELVHALSTLPEFQLA